MPDLGGFLRTTHLPERSRTKAKPTFVGIGVIEDIEELRAKLQSRRSVSVKALEIAILKTITPGILIMLFPALPK